MFTTLKKIPLQDLKRNIDINIDNQNEIEKHGMDIII